MPGSMSQADLVQDLQKMLGTAAAKIESEDDSAYLMHLEIAAFAFAKYRPRTKVGTVTLVADQENYLVTETDFIRIKTPIWGLNERRSRKQYSSNWPGTMPTVSVIEATAGMELYLSPAPTAAQIADLGSSYKYFYYAAHTVDADKTKTTIKAHDRTLFLIRAVSAALSELATSGSMSPVILGDGVGSMAKNGTPAALAEASLKLFERMAA